MRKLDIIKEVGRKTNTDRAQVERIVETLMTSIMDNVVAGHSVAFNRFGTFTLKKRKAKVARNISKNAPLYLPERYIAKFNPAKNFTNKVKNQVVE
jgi:DNA-binding protein HU-beta